MATLLGCALTEKPVRANVYDFGPGALVAAPAAASVAAAEALPPLALGDVDVSQALDGQAVLYRLNYQDAQQLRPYAYARWSAPPAQLVRQRLRETLSRSRTVLKAGESTVPLVLHIDLEEFSQQFAAPAQSSGVIRLHATLTRITAGGELPVAQRSVVVQRPAASADAPGGVAALSEATDAAAQEIAQWLAPLR
ncbi:MAG: ABC-type transport auxiliary lipoprotein family protein [Rhodoferax sp.]|nr:ABC-type transport auxiliary lipoprotein family protein [Rhodoferax sp.]